MATAFEELKTLFTGDLSDFDRTANRFQNKLREIQNNANRTSLDDRRGVRDQLRELDDQANKTGKTLRNKIANLNLSKLAAQFAAISGAFAAGFKIGEGVADFTFMADYNRELEEGKMKADEMNESLLRSQQLRQRQTKFEIGMEVGAVNQVEAFDEAIARAQRDLKGARRNVNHFKKALDDAQPSLLSLYQAGKEGVPIAEKDLEAANVRLRDQKKFVDQLIEARGRLVSSDTGKIVDPGDVKAARKLGQDLQMQVKTFGMASREAQIYKLSLKGVSDEELKAAWAANERLKYLEAQKEQQEAAKRHAEEMKQKRQQLAESIQSTKQSLMAERIELTQGAEAAQRYKLQQDGIVGTQQNVIVAMTQSNKALREQNQERERVKSAIKSRVTQLKTEFIALTQGKEAAERYKMSQEGIPPAMQNIILAKQRAIDKIEEFKDKIETAREVSRMFRDEQLQEQYRDFDIRENIAVGEERRQASAQQRRTGGRRGRSDNGTERIVNAIRQQKPVEFQEVDKVEQGG